MATGKVTKKSVDAIVAGERDAFLWDTDVKGFGLKVTPKGARTYLLQYRLGGRESPTRRYTIGNHGSPWTPDGARQRAQELLLLIDRGVDPVEDDRRRTRLDRELAFASYAALFIERYAQREQARSWKQARQVLKQHAIPRLRSKALPAIDRREIAGLLEELAGSRPATARYLHATLRKLFRWAVARGDLPHSPMTDMQAPAPPAVRDRVLSDEELATIWIVAGEIDFPFGPIYRLLIATGQRREEVAGLRWSEIDLDSATWTIPASRAKNGLAHRVPLNHLALAELRKRIATGQRDLVFSTNGRTPPSGWSKAKSKVDDLAAGREVGRVDAPWRTHDIRRTLATGLQRLGVRFEVTEAVLNHVSGARSGVAGVYQRHSWDGEKRDALGRWAEALDRLASGSTKSLVEPNVVQLRQASSR